MWYIDLDTEVMVAEPTRVERKLTANDVIPTMAGTPRAMAEERGEDRPTVVETVCLSTDVVDRTAVARSPHTAVAAEEMRQLWALLDDSDGVWA